MTECVSVKMHTDDKVDNKSNNSAASSDSGVITDEKFMPNLRQSSVGISTTITCENSDASESAVNIENLLNLAKNVCPNKQKSAANEATTKAASVTRSNKSSPALSIRSTNISITSLQSDVVSSVIDSDCDEFEDSNGNYTIKKLGQQTAFQSRDADFPHVGGSDGLVLLQQRIDADNMGAMGALAVPSSSSSALATPSTPQLGNLAFTNSTDITIGQKNYYQGPVTIQQFLIENRKQEGASPPTGGTDNPAFQNSSPASERRKPSPQDARPQLYKFLLDRRVVISTAVIIVIAVALGVAFIVVNSTASHKNGTNSTTTSGPPAKTTTESEILGNGLVVVTRSGWLAEPPKGEPIKLVLPSHRVVIAHTATPACDTKDSCGASVKGMQEYHQGPLHFDDIGFNFLVGGDGRVYEGRGWDIRGAHTKLHNSDTIGIAFIGNFMDELPPEKQLNAAKLLIEEGVKLDKLARDYRLYGARQLTSTESPGEALFANIRSWPNWSDV